MIRPATPPQKEEPITAKRIRAVIATVLPPVLAASGFAFLVAARHVLAATVARAIVFGPHGAHADA